MKENHLSQIEIRTFESNCPFRLKQDLKFFK